MESIPETVEELAALPLEERAEALAALIDQLEKRLETGAGRTEPGPDSEDGPPRSP